MIDNLNYFIRKATDWLFRKRSPALILLRVGSSLVLTTLVGGFGLDIQYLTLTETFKFGVTNSDGPSIILNVALYIGCLLIVFGVFWELHRYKHGLRVLSKQVVLSIEQRGLVNTVDSPLSSYSHEKYRGRNIIDSVIDIRDPLDNGNISNPEKIIPILLSMEHNIREKRNHVAAEYFKIVYGGIFPVPFSFLSGYLIDDESPIEILDWDRCLNVWRGLDGASDDRESFVITAKRASRRSVVVAVSFSYLVDTEAIDAHFEGMTKIHMELQNKRFDNHWSARKQNRLATDFIEQIKSLMAEGYDDIHLVLACQNSVSFRFGQAYDRRNLPMITVYQYEKGNSIKYPWGVKIPVSTLSSPQVVKRCSGLETLAN